MRVRSALLLVCLTLAACGGSGDGEGDAPAGRLVNGGGAVLDGSRIDGEVRGAGDDLVAVACSGILDWTYELVATVNGFSDVSRELVSAAARREEYLQRFGDAIRLTEELRAAISSAPATGAWRAVQEELVSAAGRAHLTLLDGRAHALGLADEDYAVLRVRSGTLFVASEKSRAQVFRALHVAGQAGHPELGDPCGRPRLPGDQAPAG